MSNKVYANNMEISCKAASGKSICAFPDVCFTPPQTPATPPGVPVPYPNTGLASDCSDGSRSIQVSGEEVMLKNKSYFKQSSGDEAGAAPKKGVVTSVNRGKVFFVAWSMDVMFEGENVVRHLDLTTHNHGSNANTGPYPYADEMAKAPGGACNGEPPTDYVEQVKANCADMYSKKCCDSAGRKCMLVPYKPNRCCDKNGKLMTPHHLVDSAEFVPHEARDDPVPSGQYESKSAPCLCLEGSDHNRREEEPETQDRLLMEHGRVGREYANLRRKFLANENAVLTVGQASEFGATSARAVHPECSHACILAQLENGHTKMGQPPENPVPRQTRKQPGVPDIRKSKK